MKVKWTPVIQKIVACLAMVAMASIFPAVGSPRTASAGGAGGIPATSLVLKAGCIGGSYNTVKTFTNAEMCAMANVQQAYSFIDSMPAPIQDPASGVRLTDLLADAGIGVNSVQSFTFYCTDGYITNFTKQALLDTPRYYYPNIVTDWDSNTGAADLPGATDGAVQVPTILAVEDNWGRFENPPDFSAMTGDIAFRLIFGQTDTRTPDAAHSAKWVREIDVTILPPASVSLTSPAVGQTFHPGDTVDLTGVAHNLATAAVNITGPDGSSVFAASSLDTSSGSLATSITLGSAAVSGQYAISITGAGLTGADTFIFNVVSPGAAVSLTAPAAGQTYWPGQQVAVAGTATGLTEVTIIIYDPDENGVYMANDLDAGSGRFSTEFTLGNDPAGGAYTVWAGLAGTSISCTSTFQVANPDQWISLTSPAADQTYNPGDMVTVAGAVYNLANVTVNITDPAGNSVFTSNLNTSGGSLARSFALSGAAVTGRYAVAISAPALVTPFTEKIDVGQGIAGGPNSGLPDQIVLSWTDDPGTTQTISWRTGSDTTQDEVEYLPAAGFSDSFAGARQAAAAENGLYPGSYHFEATIRGLNPDTGYIYRVGREGAWSQPAIFTTASSSGRFSFLYMGDVQEGYQEWGDLLQVAAKENPGPKFGLLGGDLVNDSIQDQWQQFFAAAAPLFSQIPLMPVAGNHDEETNDGAALFWNSFAVPQNGPDGYKEFYSFDYENAHIVVLDCNLLAVPGTDRFNTISAWLRRDLSSSSKTWKFVVLHYPPYQVFPDNHVANIQANWAPIFEQCGVDVVFDGHQQIYTRTSPMKSGRIQPDGHGIVYIMGNAGTKYFPCGPYYGYVVRELANVSSYEVVGIDGNTFSMTAKDANGQVIDSCAIKK
jgi:hypothetical protein